MAVYKTRKEQKKMKKRILSLLLSASLITLIPPNAKAVEFDNNVMSDIDSHWGEGDIETLYRAGIMRGDGKYARPNDNVTRGEFVSVLSRSLGLESTSGSAFSDITDGHMFYNEICAAYENNLVTGDTNGRFNPNSNITREEIMLIISRCIDSNAKASYKFKDIKSGYIYKNELEKAVSSGIISGYSNNTFRPNAKATRAESAAMTVRLMKSMPSGSKADVRSFAKKYIENDISSPQSNIANATGSALEELNMRTDFANEISGSGVNVTKSLSNLSEQSAEFSGMLSKITYTGKITYNLSGTLSDTRTYPCTITVLITERAGKKYVYHSNVNLKQDSRINLTWEVYSSAPDYSPDGVNVISPSSFQLSAENLNVDGSYIGSGITFFNSLTKAYMNYAENSGYSVWPIYKTDFTLKTSHSFLNTAQYRRAAVSQLIKYACKYGIDGINIDFENVYESDRAYLTKHIREVTLAMHELGMIVSADVTRLEKSSSAWSMCFDRDAISETADYVMLMAYDEYYAGSKTPGSVSSLDWAEDSVKLTLKEADASKLVLGMPLYMRYWEVINGKVTATSAISMHTAYKKIQENDVTYTYLEDDGQYKISWKDGNKTCMFWLENSDTVKKRVEIANKYNLAGVATWRRGFETSNIWKVIKDMLN